MDHLILNNGSDSAALAEVALKALREARNSKTSSSGSIFVSDGQTDDDGIALGTGTIINGVDGGIQQWVGDITPPGRPLGITASSTSGMVVVNWTGEIDGGIPNDFAKILVFVDGVPEGPLVERGTLAAGPYTAGSTHSVYAIAYDDAHDANGNSTPNASAQSDTTSVVIVGSDIDTSQLGITVTKSSVAPSSTNVGEHKGDLWLQYDADPDSDGAGLKAEWWWTGSQWESIPVAIYLDQLAARQINADSAVIGLLSSGIVQSGLFRTSDTVGKPSYKFAWTGTANASTSTLSQDGAVVATNYATDTNALQEIETWSPAGSVTAVQQPDGHWVYTPDSGVTRFAFFIPVGPLAQDDYVYCEWLGGTSDVYLENMDTVAKGNGWIIGKNTNTAGNRTLYFPKVDGTPITVLKVGRYSAADYAAMQARGIRWFDGDSKGDGSGVIVDGSGVRAYDASGALTFQINAANGDVTSNGGTFTGSTFRTDASSDRTEMNNAGVTVYKGGSAYAHMGSDTTYGLKAWNPKMSAMVDVSSQIFGINYAYETDDLMSPTFAVTKDGAHWSPWHNAEKASMKINSPTGKFLFIWDARYNGVLHDDVIGSWININISETNSSSSFIWSSGDVHAIFHNISGDYASAGFSQNSPGFAVVSLTPNKDYWLFFSHKSLHYRFTGQAAFNAMGHCNQRTLIVLPA